jgi:phosphomevalonate kinase
MPSASLSFRLPDDQEAFDVAQHGWRYKSALATLDTHLRNRIKYGSLAVEVASAYQAVREELHRIAEELKAEID